VSLQDLEEEAEEVEVAEEEAAEGVVVRF